MPTAKSFYAIVLRVFVCICFPCGLGQVVDVLVGAGILALLAAVGEIWGMLDFMCGDWGGAARDPELGVSGMWEWRLMGRTRSSAVHSQYCKFLPRFLWV